MRANAVILVIIGLLLLVGTVAGYIPDAITISSDKSYVFAGSGEQSIITVTTTNISTGSVVPLVNVTFAVNDPALGTLIPINAITDANGKATSLFKVSTKSGFANISVGISYSEANLTFSKILYFTQKIDHNMAQNATFTHPIEGPVGSNVSFGISFTDRYGNPIDQIINPGKQHTINLHVHGPTPDDGGFVGYGHDIIGQSLDINGNVSVGVRLSQGAGPNTVTMDTFEEVPPPVSRVITGLSFEVFSMEQVFFPDSPAQIPADGNSKFSITYSLFDKFGNPVSQQEVWVNTSIAGEEQKFKTDTLGKVMITYGPRVTIGVIDITATAVNNITVTKSKSVEFLSTAATNMVLTANPEYMPSLDINPLMTADITASVMDVMGNPVENEAITFSMGVVEYPGGPYNVTYPPSLSDTNPIMTDTEGLAIVHFIPGSFSTVNRTSSTGSATITATWNTTYKKYITVTWKNYPYLSVKTTVNPNPVATNDTVDVTISLKGDGYAMGAKPIDAVMCTDRSGSMLYNDTDHIKDDRMVLAMNAGKIFNSKMGSKDRVGLVSFGDNTATSGYASLRRYSSYIYGGAQWVGKDDTWTGDDAYINLNYPGNGLNGKYYGTTQLASIDQNLTLFRNTVDTSIGNMVPAGGTPMREGLYRAVKMQIDNPRSDAVKAIILLTDGAWNTGGDPQGGHDVAPFGVVGRGSVITWAKTNNVAIYTIRLGTEASESELKAYAYETNGTYYNAPTADDLANIYTNISQELIKDAGVNTEMVTDFQHVNVNNASIDGAEVYDYVYNSTASTKIKWQDGVTNVTDQSTDWADYKLNFTIGTIKIGQTWNATYRLKVKTSGSIDVFGPGSALYFNNGTEELTLPHTFLTVVPNLTAIGFGLQTIDVNSTCPEQAQNSVILPIVWKTTYAGPPNTITEEALYISESGARVPFWQGSYLVLGNDTRSRSAQFDMRTVPPGNYKIEVVTKAGVSAATSQPCGSYTYSTKGITFIKLE
jgi:hypothetical protein